MTYTCYRLGWFNNTQTIALSLTQMLLTVMHIRHSWLSLTDAVQHFCQCGVYSCERPLLLLISHPTVLLIRPRRPQPPTCLLPAPPFLDVLTPSTAGPLAHHPPPRAPPPACQSLDSALLPLLLLAGAFRLSLGAPVTSDKLAAFLKHSLPPESHAMKSLNLQRAAPELPFLCSSNLERPGG